MLRSRSAETAVADMEVRKSGQDYGTVRPTKNIKLLHYDEIREFEA